MNQKMVPPEKRVYVTMDVLYQKLGISRATLYDLDSKGRLPFIRDGKRKKYQLAECQEAVKQFLSG